MTEPDPVERASDDDLLSTMSFLADDLDKRGYTVFFAAFKDRPEGGATGRDCTRLSSRISSLACGNTFFVRLIEGMRNAGDIWSLNRAERVYEKWLSYFPVQSKEETALALTPPNPKRLN